MKKLTEENLSDFKKLITSYVEETFSEYHEIHPVVLILRYMKEKDEFGILHITIDPGFMKSQESKDRLADRLRNHVKENNGVASVFISESWIVIADKDHYEEATSVLPSKHPRRREAVHALIESRDFVEMNMWFVERPEGTTPFLVKGDTMTQTEKDSIKGRFKMDIFKGK